MPGASTFLGYVGFLLLAYSQACPATPNEERTRRLCWFGLFPVKGIEFSVLPSIASISVMKEPLT